MRLSLLLFLLGTVALTAAPKPPPPKAYDNPASTDDDFIIQGEYVGTASDGGRFGVQIIALGNSTFEAVSYHGGLPGSGWDGDKSKIERVQGSREPGDTTVIFKSEEYVGEVDGNKIFVSDPHGKSLMELDRVSRESPTLNAPPPAGAQILFNGKDLNRFIKASVTEDGLLTQGATSIDSFTDFTLHLEFRLPYTPTGRGQARGNSGVYLQGRYEIQLLDSFGLEGKDNECGGIYKVAVPKLNLCYPPLSWQTYDIDFTAAKFDDQGNKTANARVSVKHNGVLIHENQEIPAPTGGALLKDETTAAGPLQLQNHGNPVRFRNIWLLPK
jgi:hypothetical protein